MRVCDPQLPQLPVSGVPGAQTPWPPHVPQALQAPHVHAAVQVRELDWLPQLPHPCDCHCTAPGEQPLPDGAEHVPPWQMLTPQAELKAEQSIALPTHVPDVHVSLTVHKSPSLQVAVLLVCWQPIAASQLSVVQPFASSQFGALPGLQVPPAQLSPTVHALPSLQVAVLLVYVQPEAGAQASFVQPLPSLQTTAAPGWHAPPAQTSLLVHALPSLQATVLGVNTQPLSGAHASEVHTLSSSHTSAAPGTHVPVTQASPTVQVLPSVHAPLLLTWTQPLLGTHASSVQGLLSLQSTADPPIQLPFAHVSPVVHAEPSLQGSALFVVVQPLPTSQFSVVHGFPSSHTLGLIGLQVPPAHVSPSVQGLLSVQGCVLATNAQPVAGSQPSSVQGLPSAHVAGEPPTHTPPAHTSPCVQKLPSSQGSVLATDAQPDPLAHASVVHGLPSSQPNGSPGTQLLLTQTSFVVHALPSEQVAEFASDTQPEPTTQLSSVQGLPSLQTVGAPPTHAPSEHVSPCVHAFASSQGSAFGTAWQPLAGAQTSDVQGLPSLHTTVAPLTHIASAHVSPVVHAFPSVHAALLAVCVQPAVGSHASLVQT